MRKQGFIAQYLGLLILVGSVVPFCNALAQVAGEPLLRSVEARVDSIQPEEDQFLLAGAAPTDSLLSFADTLVSAAEERPLNRQNLAFVETDDKPLPKFPADENDTPLESETDFPRLSPEEYLFAEHPRYTLTGQPPYKDTHIQTVPAILTGTAVAGIVTGIHFYQQDAWWSDRRTDFHFQIDWGYAAQADKFGHFFAGYFASYIGYEALVASGLSRESASWLGPFLAMGFQTYVEIEDGFSPFGFDPTDQVGNMLGPIIFSAQSYLPALQHFKFKWSYFPDYSTLPDGIENGHNTIVIDDYNGQAVWLSLKMGTILPESFGWPKWLRLAVGYGAYDVDRWKVNDKGERTEYLLAGRRILFSLDYDLPELLPNLGSFGNWLVQTADYLHLPAPAIQVVPEFKFLLLYPITL